MKTINIKEHSSYLPSKTNPLTEHNVFYSECTAPADLDLGAASWRQFAGGGGEPGEPKG